MINNEKYVKIITNEQKPVKRGGDVDIKPLRVFPSVNEQTIEPIGGIEGYAPVYVDAVTSSIDSNIKAENIKTGVSILGVSGSVIPEPAKYLEYSVDNGMLKHSTTINKIIDLTGVSDIGNHLLYEAYINNTALSGTISFSPVTTISGANACNSEFRNCTNITGANLSTITTISGSSACANMFVGCSSLVAVNVENLEEITGTYGCSSMFSGTKIANMTFNSLKAITASNGCSNMFYGDLELTTVSFNALDMLTGTQALRNMFSNCSGLTDIYFYAIKDNSFGTPVNQFDSMLSNCSNVKLHFPSNLTSSVLSRLTGYPNFGGTNTTILYDLPATE